MKLKPGVRITGIKPELLLGLLIADSCYEAAGDELIVTEVTGGTHSPGSSHYVGEAADLRLPATTSVGTMSSTLRNSLGADFQVIDNESNPPTHIHIQFRPQTPL